MSWLLSDVSTWRDLLWLAVNLVAGWVLLLVPVTLVGVGVIAFLVPGSAIVPGMGAASRWVPPPAFPGNTPLVLFIIGLAMVAARRSGSRRRCCGATPAWPGWYSPRRHRPSSSCGWPISLRTRSETLDTGAAELRRVERDLHDGAQARLVAMGMSLDVAQGLIEKDPVPARACSPTLGRGGGPLPALRDLVRGILPPVLADRGLAEAVRAIVLDGPIPVGDGNDRGGLPDPVESAAYFAVASRSPTWPSTGGGGGPGGPAAPAGGLLISAGTTERAPTRPGEPGWAELSVAWPRSTAAGRDQPARRPDGNRVEVPCEPL